jgi:ABC-type bacteriocin/lantibiotic exporter with double-glycine peptidase domain
MTRTPPLFALLVAIQFGWPVAAASSTDLAQDNEFPRPMDCATGSLYLLLRLEGLDVEPAAVVRQLPSERHSGGYSMAELREAATRLGLRLKGVRLATRGQIVDRPAIVFSRREGHGHFFVLRPLSVEGQYQVLDLDRSPIITTADSLLTSDEWTGLALVLDRPNYPAIGLVATAAGLASLALGRTLLARRRWPA